MNFLPGPVPMDAAVLAEMSRPPINHRSAAFGEAHKRVSARLRDMTGAAEVALLFGSGTLANDAIAAHLQGPGVVLSNGEFGDRLVRHCDGRNLDFAVSRRPWGELLDYKLSLPFKPSWLWAVHCETSTGVLNDIDHLKAVAKNAGAKLVLDCVSSLGAVDIDLSGVHMASSVSGKALQAPSGVAVVFADRKVSAAVPPYLALDQYWQGNPHTFNSGLLFALEMALERPPHRPDGSALRARLRDEGFDVIGDGTAPHVVTIAVHPSLVFGGKVAERGYSIAYESGYLVDRGWVQVCLMAPHTESEIDGLIEAMIEARSEC